MRKKQDNSYQGTALAIAHMTDAARFQTLCDRLLEAHWQYELHPRGASEHGTVPGQPDSWDGTQTEEYAHSNMAFVHAQAGLESFRMILKKLTL